MSVVAPGCENCSSNCVGPRPTSSVLVSSPGGECGRDWDFGRGRKLPPRGRFACRGPAPRRHLLSRAVTSDVQCFAGCAFGSKFAGSQGPHQPGTEIEVRSRFPPWNTLRVCTSLRPSCCSRPGGLSTSSLGPGCWQVLDFCCAQPSARFSPNADVFACSQGSPWSWGAGSVLGRTRGAAPAGASRD